VSCFGDFPQVVVLASAAVADLADSDDVQHAVQRAVASGVEVVAGVPAAGSVQGRCAGVAGEVVLGREACDVPDVSKELGGEHGAQLTGTLDATVADRVSGTDSTRQRSDYRPAECNARPHTGDRSA
jgi:hypothetical protein